LPSVWINQAFDKFCSTSDKIWLEGFPDLADDEHMNVSYQASDTNTSPLATARYDRESKERRLSDGLRQKGHPLRLAMILQIPVGYEDETGFHNGEPRVQANLSVFEPEIGITRFS